MEKFIGMLFILILFLAGCNYKKCHPSIGIELININDELVANHGIRRIYFDLLLTNEYEDTLSINLDESIYYYEGNGKEYLKSAHFMSTDFDIRPKSSEYVTFFLDHADNGTVYELFLKLKKVTFYTEIDEIEYRVCHSSGIFVL